jgi:hypothetical protein
MVPKGSQLSFIPVCPILRPPAAVCNCPNHDHCFLLEIRIDDRKRKSPKQKSAGIVLAERPPVWRFANRVYGAMQFFNELQRRRRASLAIPGDSAHDIGCGALVIFDALSAHSPWPGARGGVGPTKHSLTCRLSGLPSVVPLPRPRHLLLSVAASRGCQAKCWLTRHARRWVAPELVSRDR